MWVSVSINWVVFNPKPLGASDRNSLKTPARRKSTEMAITRWCGRVTNDQTSPPSYIKLLNLLNAVEHLDPDSSICSHDVYCGECFGLDGGPAVRSQHLYLLLSWHQYAESDSRCMFAYSSFSMPLCLEPGPIVVQVLPFLIGDASRQWVYKKLSRIIVTHCSWSVFLIRY